MKFSRFRVKTNKWVVKNLKPSPCEENEIINNDKLK